MHERRRGGGWATKRVAPLFFCGVLAGISATTALGQADQLRPLTYDDLLRLEGLGVDMGGDAVAFSPDGDEVAYVRLRPKADAAVHDLPLLQGNDRGDLWLASTASGEPRRITDGASDGSGYWAPLWSPDGARLALLSNRDDDIRLYAWERATGELIRLSERGTDVPGGTAPSASRPIWLSNSEIVFAVLPQDRQAMILEYMRSTPQRAAAAWAQVRGGAEATASVVESGAPVDPRSRPQRQLLLYDLRTDETTVLFEGDVRLLVPSPDNERVAALVVGNGLDLPRAGAPVPLPAPFHHAGYEIQLVDRSGALPPGELATVTDVLPGSLEWAPDGSRFAFAGRVGEADESAEQPYDILVFTPRTGSLRSYPLHGLTPVMGGSGFFATPPRMRWSADGRLLIYAREAGNGRPDWWLVDESGERRNLTAALPAAPAQLYRVAVEASWVGLSSGDLWRVPEQESEPISLTEELAQPIAQLAWVDQAAARNGGVVEIIGRTGSGTDRGALYRVELHGEGRIDPIKKPRPTAELIDYSAAAGLAIFGADDRTGLYLWSARPGPGEPRLLFETNLFLREVAQAEVRRITYESLDGDSLFAWVLLPPASVGGPTDGRGHPLVTYVYAGDVAGPDVPPWRADEINNPSELNMQLLAGKGYAVLFPSMPLPSPVEPGDPYGELTKGVLPAVDRAIELGIADPDRLAVMGESFGGYSTYGLITQTERFHAAIARAGITNLVSLYGQFESHVRYQDFPHEQHTMMLTLERAYALAAPPWEDMERYVRNSPITYVDRVETPVLMLHGDLDYIAMQQAEEFFTGLYRQGKRARLVRYWGEWHGFASPANVRDMWEEIFGWLDEYLDVRERAADAG